MRKRTQLVGFEFGYWKHVQYCAEFLDNALDAIETFQWNELKKDESKLKFTLDKELFLENLTVLQKEKEEESSQILDEEAKKALLEELKPMNLETKKEEEIAKPDADIAKEEIEIELEVKKIINDLESLIKPVEHAEIIDKEPLVIIRLTETEAHSVLTGELDAKNVMSYKFEVFDNGLGMSKIDLKKYGKYLASSKSMELKQTRGSQGFGAPSAFSDAQNTTGKPIVTISKTSDHIYATVSEFFTTSKNEKKYVIHPTDIDSPFLHGTYIKLNYLNTKYVRGYVDTYVKETALMNPHVTIIYIDPYGEEFIFPRKVSNFPDEPKYAKPHPSSTNIGDLQDLLSKSEHLSLTSFLQDNFVRMSYNTAKEVVDLAERDLQDKLGLLIVDNAYVNKIEKKKDDVYYIRFEKRVYGRSDRPRDKLIIYEVEDSELKEEYLKIIREYDEFNKQIEDLNKKIKKNQDKIQDADTKKEKRKIRKENRDLRSSIEDLRENKDKTRNKLSKIFKANDTGLKEIKDKKVIDEYKDLIDEVLISDSKPNNLSNDQFNSLFLAFKSVKYMSPPTDTVVPVGDVVLENTMIKELGLKVSENLDDFASPVKELQSSRELIKRTKKNRLLEENPELEINEIDQIKVEDNEIKNLNTRILSSYKNVSIEKLDDFKSRLNDLLQHDETEDKNEYKKIFSFFVEKYTRKDDFVAAETRDPTSGKGLAYIVEAVLAYSHNLEVPKRSRDVLSRFVNRTPKLRDTADCAITKAVQSVNWKNYKIDSYDNGLPKGPIKLLVNVSGPYVHLMFKSQSKNSLADDENLINEIKYCLEAIGRRLRVYLNRRANIRKREKRASLIEKYIPKFVESLYNIAQEGSKYKDKIKKEELETLMSTVLSQKEPSKIDKITLDKEKIEKETKKKIKEVKGPKEEIEKKVEEKKEIEVEKGEEKREIKKEKEKVVPEKEKVPEKPEKEYKLEEKLDLKNLDNYTVNELKSFAEKKDINITTRLRKDEIIEKILNIIEKKERLKKQIEIPISKETVDTKAIREAKQKVKTRRGEVKKKAPPVPRKSKQQKLPVITTEKILEALSEEEWQTIKHLIFTMRIKDMLDARFLQIKLKELTRKGIVEVDSRKGKKYWKLPSK
jgi:DNA topoisomerase VI B subunit